MNLAAALYVYKRFYGPLESVQGTNLEQVFWLIEEEPILDEHKAFLLATFSIDTLHFFSPTISPGTPSAFKHLGEGELAQRLGNTDPKDAFKYRPRGYNGVAGKKYYARIKDKYGVDVLRRPDQLAKDAQLAYRVAVEGVTEGWLTGHKLEDVLTPENQDFAAARARCSILGGKSVTFAKCVEIWTKALHAFVTVPQGKKLPPRNTRR